MIGRKCPPIGSPPSNSSTLRRPAPPTRRNPSNVDSILLLLPPTYNAKRIKSASYPLRPGATDPAALRTARERLSMDGYENLPLSWECDVRVSEFEESSFVRKEWNRDGKVERGQPFLALEPRHRLDDLAKGCSTASMVVRWRAARKEQTEKGDVEDCIDSMVRRLKEALDGQDWMKGGLGSVLLIIKQK